MKSLFVSFCMAQISQNPYGVPSVTKDPCVHNISFPDSSLVYPHEVANAVLVNMKYFYFAFSGLRDPDI